MITSIVTTPVVTMNVIINTYHIANKTHHDLYDNINNIIIIIIIIITPD